MIVSQKINVSNIKERVNAADSLILAGEDDDAKKLLLKLASDILKELNNLTKE